LYRLLISLLLLFFAVAPVSCDSATGNNEEVVNGIANVVVHSIYSQEVVYKEIPSARYRGGVTMNYGIGFVRPADIDTIYPEPRTQIREFLLQEGEPFAPFLSLLNFLQNPSTYLITAILDYRQVSFELDGKEGLLHEVTVPPGTGINLPFSLNIDDVGAHDVQVILFKDPYNLAFDDLFRMSLSGHAMGFRTVVIVGEDEAPARFLEPTITGSPIPSDVTFTPRIGFAYAPSSEEIHPSRRQLYVGEALAGKLYPFQMHLNNPDENEAVIQAMIPFFNYHQVEINGSEVLVANLESGQEAIVDVGLALPEEPGIHQFQCIYLFDPYQPVLLDEVYDPFVVGSPRIAINAR
jgi:hypothetical protein